jgi:DNA polymerase III subunit epsilon
MSREIVLDTETTGMDPADGHRIIEIGCVELLNHLPTGNVWHHYINPEREVDAGAVAVHGIKTEFLKDKPTFGELVGSLLDFIGSAPLVIHNAAFDIKFLNAELKGYGFPAFKVSEAIDTVMIARKKYPGSPANLDALCRRFSIDLSGRDYHGALLDAQLLASVYLELLGGRQHGLGLASNPNSTSSAETYSSQNILSTKERPYREPRHFPIDETEAEAHQKMLSTLKQALWAQKS